LETRLQQGTEDFLGGCLARTASHGNDRLTPFLPDMMSQLLQCYPRVIYKDDGPTGFNWKLSVSGGDDKVCTLPEGSRDELMTIKIRPSNGDETIAHPQGSRIN
jgi:hypothetical protein